MQKLSMYVLIAIAGVVIISSALSNRNEQYFVFGFFTLAYGIAGQIIDNAFHSVFNTPTTTQKKFLFYAQFILLGIWFYLIISGLDQL